MVGRASSRWSFTFGLVAVVAFASGCDPTFTTHLRAKVRQTAGPATGAWVVPIECPRAAVRVNEEGLAITDHGGFLENTSDSPVLVALPGYRTLVAVTPGDFALRPRHWFQNAEWDAELAVMLVPLPARPGLQLECGAGRCHMRIPCSYGDSCHPLLVAMDSARVRVVDPSPPPPEGYQAGSGAWEVEFALPPDLDRPVDLVGVATYVPARGAVVTDTVRLEP